MLRKIALTLCCLTAAFAQSPAPVLTFEAAAIKPAPPQAPGKIMVGIEGGPGSSKPGQMNFYDISIADLIQNAWDVKSFQVSGPDWMQSAHFDIQAKVPAGTTQAQSKIMLQNLLAERFKLVLHHSTKELTLCVLVPDKSGPKLKINQDDVETSLQMLGIRKAAGKARIVAIAAPMESLAFSLEKVLGG